VDSNDKKILKILVLNKIQMILKKNSTFHGHFFADWRQGRETFSHEK